MRALFRILSFASGVALNAALVYFDGYLAAIPTPKGYFESFAKPHWQWALSAFTFVTFNIPLFLFCAVWCGLTVRYLLGAHDKAQCGDVLRDSLSLRCIFYSKTTCYGFCLTHERVLTFSLPLPARFLARG